MEYLLVHFADSVAPEFMGAFNNSDTPYHLIPHLNDRQDIFQEKYQALECGYNTDTLGYANTCLWHFLGSLCFSNTYERLKSESDSEEKMVETSISFMKKNLHCSLSLEELAQNVHYSVSYFSSLFKKETGYSPIDYFIYLKTQKACHYLDLTDLNISEIAQKIGYNNNHYFSRIFRKVMGLSPTRYRKKQKG